jgi:uncharacterized protein (DUF2236 family)
MTGPIDRLRRKVVGSGRSLLWASRFPDEQYSEPRGDKGLFGPDSPAWRVHSDTSMFVGGLSAILVQMLHPLAMAGVADHSNWVQEPIRRLSRTASFITATTFGSTPVAEAVIEQVRRRHARVNGTVPDGRSYRADDPDLLRWVHTAQVSSFLAAHLRFHPAPIGPADQDRYFRDSAEVARRLGATDVPNDRKAVADYMLSMQPELAFGPQAHTALQSLQDLRLDGRTQTLGYRLFLRAAADTIPPWAQRQLNVAGSTTANVITPRLLSQLRRARGTPEWLEEALARCAP